MRIAGSAIGFQQVMKLNAFQQSTAYFGDLAFPQVDRLQYLEQYVESGLPLKKRKTLLTAAVDRASKKASFVISVSYLLGRKRYQKNLESSETWKEFEGARRSENSTIVCNLRSLGRWLSRP